MKTVSEKYHKIFSKKIWFFFVLLFTVAIIILSDVENILGVFDSERAVHIKPDEIENSTLIIGTHLIYLYGLNDEIYDLAKDSAATSGQSKIYYKSELSDGAWFDITEADSLKEITDQGKKVDNGEIEVLFFTHHTKSDGITYDLLTNQPVGIFDIKEHYELENLEELEAVKLQYDMMEELKGKSDTVKRNLNLTEYFFSTETHTEDTDLYDMQMKALQTYYTSLSGEDSTFGEVVMHVMKKLDYARRFIVLGIAEEQLEILMDSVGDTYPDNGETEEVEFTVDNVLLTAIGESQSVVGESMAEAQGNRLDQGTTAISKMEYELSMDLIREAVAENYQACDTSVARLRCLFNITEGVIKDREGELDVLESLKKTTKEEEADYVLRQIEIRREGEVSEVSDPEEKRLEELWEKKERLREKKAESLDHLDIETAKKIEAELVLVSEEIESLDGAEAADSYSSQAKNITDTKNALEEAISKGDISDSGIASLEKDLEALKAMLDAGSSLAMSAMKDVYAKMVEDAYLKEIKAYDDLLEKIENAIEASNVLTMEQKGGLTREMAKQVLEEMDGQETDKASLQEENEKEAARILGLGEYAKETGNGEIISLAEGKAAMLSKGSGYVFETYELLGEKYIPIDILADYLGYRYVWNDTKKNGILSRGRTYYSFTAFSDVVESQGSRDIMGKAAQLKGTVYIPASYVEIIFHCNAREIYGTGYSVLVGEEIIEQSEEVTEILRQKGGASWE
ncbi:MAG: stalk domain-containing protein [Roseburia sp.]|nr:stalk domain-containing protein [Roseburia sp.]